MKVFIHDYETTGIDPKTCGVVQSATGYAEVNEDGSYEITELEAVVLDPLCEIHPKASEVHGLYPKDVEGKQPFDEYLTVRFADFDCDVVCGYNSNSYDNIIAKRFGLPETKHKLDLIVATRRLKAKKIIENAKLTTAYETLVGKPADKAHDAEFDIKMTLDLIKPCMNLLEINSLTELLDFLSQANNTMPFGKYTGKKFSEVPKSYIKWLLTQDINDDLRLKLENSL